MEPRARSRTPRLDRNVCKIAPCPRRSMALVFLASSLSIFSVEVAGAADASTVSAGYQHSCVVTNEATVKCFGGNTNGELGIGNSTSRGNKDTVVNGMGDLLPAVDLGTGASAVAVSAGWTHTCAVLASGSVKCWGRNDDGQLGYGDYQDRGDDPDTMGDNLPAVDLGTAPSGNGTAKAIAVTTGQQFTCVLIEGGGVKCFGRNDEGQCGRGNLDTNIGSSEEDMGDSLPYVDLGTGVEAISVSSGTSSTCAALQGGGIKCWGGNSYGGLGLGDAYNRGDDDEDMGDNLPEVDLGSGETGSSVFYGLRHACAILVGGEVKCWGDNRSGELGLGDVDTVGDDDSEMGDSLPSIDLGSGAQASMLSLGESHSCAILADDAGVRCWGKGFSGQLGSEDFRAKGKAPGEMGSSLGYVDLGTNSTVVSIAAGHDHTCAVLDDGSLKCWGLNEKGGLGLGDTESRGDESGEMGDELPAVSLGTGLTVALEEAVTLPPTAAPTSAPTTKISTARPSSAPTGKPVAQPTPEPTMALTDSQTSATTPSPTTSSPDVVPDTSSEAGEDTPSPIAMPDPTPSPVEAPATPSPSESSQASTSSGMDQAEASGSSGSGGSDDGVFSTDNITVAACIVAPLLAFAVLACVCARRRYRSRDPSSASIAARKSYKNAGAAHRGGGLGGYADADSAAGRAGLGAYSGSSSSAKGNGEALAAAGDSSRSNVFQARSNSTPGATARVGSGRALGNGRSPVVALGAAGVAYDTAAGSGADGEEATGSSGSGSASGGGSEDEMPRDSLDVKGWGQVTAHRNPLAGRGALAPPSYADTQARERRQPQQAKGEGEQQYGPDWSAPYRRPLAAGTERSGSHRERNSERALARAVHAGRPGVPRRGDVPGAIADAADHARVDSLRNQSEDC